MNIALLIDCENAAPDSIHGILSELAEKGTINIRRAYGNWKNQAGGEQKLHPFAIQPVQQFAYTKGKNAIDMCMAIDAMDLLYSEKVDSLALLTNDTDLMPLAHNHIPDSVVYTRHPSRINALRQATLMDQELPFSARLQAAGFAAHSVSLS